MNQENKISIYEKLMQQAINVASTSPCAPYGAIIVYKDAQIIAQSVNNTQENPLLHGEIAVLNSFFAQDIKNLNFEHLSLYTTAEPCPMCISAIYWAKIPKIIYGTSIPFLHNLFGTQINLRAKKILQKIPNMYKYEIKGKVLEKNAMRFLSKLKICKKKLKSFDIPCLV